MNSKARITRYMQQHQQATRPQLAAALGLSLVSTNAAVASLEKEGVLIPGALVPSGGGQWGVQGPIVMPAADNLGVEPGRAAMAIAWGDQWTNMIQPFWALPALGVAKLSAKDIMGYLVIVLLFTGVVACAGFLVWGLIV